MFRAAADLPDGRVAALRVPGGGTLTRKEIDDYTAFVEDLRRAGPRLHQGQRRRRSRTRRACSRRSSSSCRPSAAARDPRAHRRANGDLIFFGADREKVVNDALGALRAKVGHERGFATPGWKPLWVVDFPMFEYDDETKTWAARHHPFTAPKDGHEDLFATDPGHALAKAYDVVLNGWEIGGGSVRIHRQEVQAKVFAALEASAPRTSAASSASCSTRCSTARRRTAASRSASTASSR